MDRVIILRSLLSLDKFSCSANYGRLAVILHRPNLSDTCQCFPLPTISGSFGSTWMWCHQLCIFASNFFPRLHRWVHLSSNLISFDHHWIFHSPKVYFSDLARYISHLIITGIFSLLTSHGLMTRQVPLIWKRRGKGSCECGMDCCWGRRNVEHKQFRDIGFWGFWGWYLRFWFFRFQTFSSSSSWLASPFPYIDSGSQKIGQLAPLRFSEIIKF